MKLLPGLRLSKRELWEADHAFHTFGSMGLGLWLARYKERTTKKRAFTTAEYGGLVHLILRGNTEETE